MIRTIEVLSLLATFVLASLWICYPSGNYEPFTIISGAVFTTMEIYRRRTKMSTEPKALLATGQGGAGGNAKVGSGTAIGGKGGGGGVPGNGPGGAGGNAEVAGHGIALGGEGGEAAQVDRGGRGGRNGLEVLGIPNEQLPDGRWTWDIGRGGNGGAPQNQDDTTQSSTRSNDSEPLHR
ncbi:hypothetical protein ATI02_5438 [Pseudomonas baetica]|uniref:Uncharacterized protein n=1 Tax=Pseudomonas baetica TaxID=674054 RepID=A0ABX4Q6L6_9PSED|nr:hypothetical protein ATI02_5438 [Pseudomonas baetica]